MIEFFTYLNGLAPLSPEATAALLKIVKTKEYRKGQVVLQEGSVCDKIYFVVKGMLKLCFEVGTKEVILQLSKENECMVSAGSYFGAAPSAYSIRAVEPSVVVMILKADINYLCEKFPEFNFYLLSIAHTQVKLLEEHTGLLMLPPLQRYNFLHTSCSWLINGKRITDRLLSSYLGVRANTVCEWRRGK